MAKMSPNITQIKICPYGLLSGFHICSLGINNESIYCINDNDNDNEIDLFRHHNGNNTNIKVIFKQVTMLDKCNCI